MRTSYGTSRYQASEADYLFNPQPAGTAPRPRGCLYFGGHGQTAATYSGYTPILALPAAGLRTMIADWGGPVTWANDTAVARAETGRVYQQTAQGVATDKVVLVGGSMGSCLALRYAMAHPTRVAAISLVLPFVDPQGMYDADIGGWAAEIGTAYGGRPSDAQNPLDNPEAFDGIPIHMWYSTDDPLTLPGPALDFAAATGAGITSLGAVQHTFPSSLTDVAGFVAQYA